MLNKIDCDAIVLFDSYEKWTQNNKSDIDIAIKTKCEVSKKDIFYISQEMEDKISIEVDLINLDRIEDGFRYEILISGKTLYCRNELEFELYKLDMYREYLELNESRKDIIENLKKGKYLWKIKQ